MKTKMLTLLLAAVISTAAGANELANISDFSGTWMMVHQGNSGTLVITQDGATISGYMITEKGHKTSISGKVEDIGKWDIKKITFARQLEPQVFTAYMFTHGSKAGLEIVGGWYAVRLHK